jgi:N6-L-threonylcarbamoyladenine synthase
MTQRRIDRSTAPDREASITGDSRRQLLLALETTCDETAAAVIDSDLRVLASEVASQSRIHQPFDGVVPELAARAHLDRIVPVIDRVMRSADVSPEQEIVAIAVATEPGLPGSLLVGLAAAKALCLAWNKPLVAVNHVHAHVYACQLDQPQSIFPCLGFVISGGHTNLYHCESADRWQYLGGTIDDAAGEAFDKVAVMLGLPYPGGVHLSRLADSGDDSAFAFPRPLLHDRSTLNLSFSGLKTAVRYKIAGTGKQDFHELNLPQGLKADLAASFQRAVIDCIVGKAELAIRRSGLKRICVGGGVAANQLLRRELHQMALRRKVELLIAPPEMCTDNAVMGAIAWEKIKLREFSSMEIDIQPGLVRA